MWSSHRARDLAEELVGEMMPRKALLTRTNVRDGRLHGVRHTAAPVLLVLGVPGLTTMSLMGWSSTAMAARYPRVTDPIPRDIARRVGGLFWADAVSDDGAN